MALLALGNKTTSKPEQQLMHEHTRANIPQTHSLTQINKQQTQ
jgi:hypothetical protein